MKLCTEKRSDSGGYWEPFRRDKDGNVVCWISKDKRMLRSEELRGLPSIWLDQYAREHGGFRRGIKDECNWVTSRELGIIKNIHGVRVPVWHVVSTEFKFGVYSKELLKKISFDNAKWYLARDSGALLVINTDGTCGIIGCEVCE